MNHSVTEVLLVASVAYIVELSVVWFFFSAVKKAESREQDAIK